ncbi:MAG: PDGLE domain-containing protein [Armatimonadota bacterium]
MKTTTKLWIGLLALIMLSPLGLILPAKLGAGSAWGEWSAEEIRNLVGYVPSGMSKLCEFWKAPMPDYAFSGQDSAPMHALNISYIIAGVVGVAIVAALTILVGKALARRENNESS